MDLWQIDSWDGNESFKLIVDDKEVYSHNKSGGANGGSLDCGGTGGWKDNLLFVAVEIPHTSNTIKI